MTARTSNDGARPRLRTINAKVTPAAYTAWQEWCGARGVSFTAVIQAVGEGLDATGGKFQAERDFIPRARQIDLERRQRPTLRRED